MELMVLLFSDTYIVPVLWPDGGRENHRRRTCSERKRNNLECANMRPPPPPIAPSFPSLFPAAISIDKEPHLVVVLSRLLLSPPFSSSKSPSSPASHLVFMIVPNSGHFLRSSPPLFTLLPFAFSPQKRYPLLLSRRRRTLFLSCSHHPSSYLLIPAWRR